MELRNLTTFLKIVETGSFSKAAEQLMYSQSTVTIQIQQLEEELHVKLFDRIGKKVYVTEKGQELHAYALQMTELAQKISLIGTEMEELQGTLSIVSFDSLSFSMLPAILLRYHQRHPKVSILVKTSDSLTEVKRHLSQNEADLGFVFSENKGVKDLICPFSHREEIVFSARADHPLAQKDVVTFADLAKEDIIISNKHAAFSEIYKEHTKFFKDYQIKPAFDIFQTAAAVELVKLGGGIIFVPHYMIADAKKRGELCVLRVPEINNSVWIQALYHQNKLVTPQMKAFFALLQELYRNEA